MRSPTRSVLLVGLLILAAGSRAEAQCSSTASPATCVLRVNLPTVKVAQFRLSSASTAFGAISLTHLNAGQVDATGPTFSVKANLAFQVQIHSTSATFSGGSGAKPRSDLQWKLASSGGGYTAMSGTAATVHSSATGAAFSDGILYRMLLSFLADAPGSYSLPVIITLAAP